MTEFGDEVRRLMTEQGLSARELARRSHWDASHLSKVLNGRKPVTRGLAAAVGDVLGAREALISLADDAISPGWNAPHSRVTVADVEAAREITRTFRSLDNKFGGAHAHSLAATYLDSTVIPMLRTGSYTETTGQDLFSIAAQLAHLAAWTAYDMGDHRRAQRYFAKALELAAAAGDQGFGGEILAAGSHHAIHLGNAGRAAELARASQQVAQKAGIPALLAEACTLEAGSHALTGDGDACAVSLSRAEEAFSRAETTDTPEWLGYFGEGYLAIRFAHCLRDLGDSDQARRYAQHAASLDPGMIRTRVFNTILVATTYADADPAQACSKGMEALTLAADLQSGRVTRYVTDLEQRLRKRHASETVVKQFRQYATETLGTRT